MNACHTTGTVSQHELHRGKISPVYHVKKLSMSAENFTITL
jgi:hypothetical protein